MAGRENELSAFLRSRRARLDPTAYGYSLTRRRTAGLRREEVARLADVSPSWYTWLEQGRDIQVSAPALERVSEALRLDSSEREHLFLLAHERPPPRSSGPAPIVGESLHNLLAALEPTPAYVRTARLDVLAWNATAARVFLDWGLLEQSARNSMRLLFLHPPYRERIVNWEEIARRTVATFRAAHAMASDPAPFQALADDLRACSQDFAAIWEEIAVQPFGEGRKVMDHPELGRLEMEHVSLVVEGQPDLRVVAFVSDRRRSARA